MFQHAQNLMFNGGTFSSQSHQHYYSGVKDKGFDGLKQYIATDAIFDAAERFPPPKCHPGTREKVIKAIMGWISDTDAEEQAMWLYGPAGAGKSAIAQSISILLQEIMHDSKYAASFFFTKDAPGCGDGNKLFPTIAYQLAINFPSFRPHLDAAMISNPTLPTKSIDIQLRDLIIEPLKHVDNWPTHHPTVIIDGLDECSGSKRMQLALLSNLYKAITDHQIPLRFLIVSRPEYWITDYFQVGAFSHASRKISLHDDTEADAGIKLYLQHEFARIYEENLPLMYSVPLPWPPEDLIQWFVSCASGQFVYASTVIKFVGDESDFCNPQEQLRILAKPNPHYAAPAFSDLDQLYATILSMYPRLECMRCVLGAILCNLHLNIIQEFFSITLEEIYLVLKAIGSLIHIKTDAWYPYMYRVLESTYGPPLLGPQFGSVNNISFSHLSFKEFLRDPSRSGCYSVDTRSIETHVNRTLLGHGCQMLQDCLGDDDLSSVDQSISRIGLSIYRDLLCWLYKLSEVYYQHYLLSVMEIVQDIDSILRTVLSQKPVRLAQASHILWFATHMVMWLQNLPLHLKPFIYHQELFRSLLNNLDVIMGISTKQLLEEIPIHMPVFSYLAAHSTSGGNHCINDIKKTLGITYEDVILELQHLHSFIYMSFHDSIPCIEGHRLIVSQFYKHIQDSQQLQAWDIIRLRPVASSKDRLLAVDISGIQDDDRYPQRDSDIHIIDSYLQCKQHSDIDSPDYFEDGLRRTVLDLVIHPQFPEIVLHIGLSHFVIAALSWLDRQMTGPRKILIAEYDNSLLQKMKSAAKNIFLKAYIPYFTNGYSSNLLMTHEDPELNVHLRISSQLTNGTYSIIKERYCDGHQFLIDQNHRTDPVLAGIYIYSFHETMMTSESSGIISPADWYPHLAAFLINMLVRSQYGTLYPGFEDEWARGPWKVFGALPKCLPFATPTEQNLNAMRALHYLCPKIDRDRRWRPPYGFCSLTIEFLKKYDESSLSRLEFARFRAWLYELKTHQSKRIIVDSECINSADLDDDYTTDEDEDD